MRPLAGKVKKATDTIPVVIAAIGYPVESRVVESFSLPGHS
jgi:ABC-type uncharacterized transport system substrate-binding protein